MEKKPTKNEETKTDHAQKSEVARDAKGTERIFINSFLYRVCNWK